MSFALLWGPMDSAHKGPLTWKRFPCRDLIMCLSIGRHPTWHVLNLLKTIDKQTRKNNKPYISLKKIIWYFFCIIYFSYSYTNFVLYHVCKLQINELMCWFIDDAVACYPFPWLLLNHLLIWLCYVCNKDDVYLLQTHQLPCGNWKCVIHTDTQSFLDFHVLIRCCFRWLLFAKEDPEFMDVCELNMFLSFVVCVSQ